jgi:hypothetical protein
MEQRQSVDRGHIFETDQDVGPDEIVLTDGNGQRRVINN